MRLTAIHDYVYYFLGMAGSGRAWYLVMCDELRQRGFKRTRFDPDVWIRLNESKDGYDFVGTHTDDLKAVGKNGFPSRFFEDLQIRYHMKGTGEPAFHLGNDYIKVRENGRDIWYMSSESFCKRALERIAALMGKDSIQALGRENLPHSPGGHPEEDRSDFCEAEEHQLYQQILGSLNWAVIIGRYDLGYTTSSMSRFSSKPRQNHLRQLYRAVKYLNKFPTKRIRIDPRDYELPKEA